jgi:hypothetical protein
VIIGLCIWFLGGESLAQDRIDLQALIQETQKHSLDPGHMTIVWWMPSEFWRASLAQNPGIRKEQTEAILQILAGYTMVAVADGSIGPFGGVTFNTEDVVRSGVTVRDPQGRTHSPLDNDSIDVDAKNLLQMLRPGLGNTLGSLGQNIYFVLFRATADGRPIADPKGKGTFTVVLRDTEYSYRLPLGSLLPPKYDPATRETFPGNYMFNPFTGGALTAPPPSK